MKNGVVAVWVWAEQAWSRTVFEEWERCEMQWMKVRSHGVEPDVVGRSLVALMGRTGKFRTCGERRKQGIEKTRFKRQSRTRNLTLTTDSCLSVVLCIQPFTSHMESMLRNHLETNRFSSPLPAGPSHTLSSGLHGTD